MKIVKETESEPMETRVALHPFLADMGRSQLALLIDCATPVDFDANEVILRAGEWRIASI